MDILERVYPQVDRRWLRFAAGLLWCAAGVMLLVRAEGWLSAERAMHAIPLEVVGLAAALVIGRFKFGAIAERNIRRIESLNKRVGLWAFQSPLMYVMIAGMMGLGIALRHSAVPKAYLAVLYLGIGGGLVVASLRYFKR